MGEVRQSSKFLKKCIEDTIFILMDTRPFNEIDVKLLCEKAYVGRTSFYRYFKSLEDVILFAFIRMWSDWCDVHQVKERKKFTLDNALTFFEYNLSIKDKLNLIYKNNLEYILLNAFESIMLDNNGHNYIERFYGYGLFALLKEWWIRDFKESPEELKIILEKTINQY